MKYNDVHSHLCLSDYPVDQTTVIANMQKKDVGAIIIGTNIEDSKEVVKIAEANKNIWACIGVHPKEGVSEPVFDEIEFEKLVKNLKVVAIGECGLDYFFKGDSLAPEGVSLEKVKQKQKEVFIQQIEFAIKYNKPLMIHTRDSYSDTYEILNSYKGKVRGNLHFFAGDLDWAKKFIDLGFSLSFTGVITFARNYDDVIKNVPLDMIHAETDAPFVAPVPYRGQRNEPAYVIEVYKKIAEIRGENPESVRLQLLENAKRVFKI